MRESLRGAFGDILRGASSGPSNDASVENLRRAAWEPLLRIIQSERTRWASMWTDLDLTPAQGFMLLKLRRLGPGSMSMLAGAMQCDASNITGLVDKLEARGFIERGNDPQDRRVKILSVTPDGISACEQIQTRMRVPPECFSVLKRGDLIAIRKALSKAADVADTAPNPFAPAGVPAAAPDASRSRSSA